jgi:hypothetical protein
MPYLKYSASGRIAQHPGRIAHPAFRVVSVSPMVSALEYPHDTNHQWVTIICSVDIVCRATSLNNADRYHEWQMCAIYDRNLGGIAKEYLA